MKMFGLFRNPSKEKFAALVLRKIAEQGGPTDFVFLPDQFEIRCGSNRGFLGNVYTSYCQAKGAQRDSILNNFVSVMVDLPKHTESRFEEVRADIAIVVRERALLAFTSLLWQLDGVEKPPKIQAEPISAWFAKALVIDAPSYMSLASEEQLSGWGCPPYELYALGLQKLTDAKAPAFSADNGVFRGTWDDDYDSSRILIPGIFDDLPLRGKPIVTIPNRLTLLVAGSEDTNAVRRMLATAEEIVRTKAKPQNPAPLVIRNGDVFDYSVPATSPIFNEVERAKRLAALFYYTEQKERLDELYEKNGKDFFVATYTLNRLDSGAHISCAVWTKGGAALLPVVDEIVFVDTDRPKGQNVVARVRWPVAAKFLADLMLDTEMFPQRFYVSSFPSPEQLLSLLSKSRE
jgi:hypothetical protein